METLHVVKYNAKNSCELVDSATILTDKHHHCTHRKPSLNQKEVLSLFHFNVGKAICFKARIRPSARNGVVRSLFHRHTVYLCQNFEIRFLFVVE